MKAIASHRFVIFCLVFTSLLLVVTPNLLFAADDAITAVARGLRYRLVGPFRGGRATSVTGVPGDPLVYYFGAAAGGVWKTTDAGVTWEPKFDAQPIASIGALAVSASNPEILYVGTGEACLRADGSHGNGVYKSVDGGESWTHLGLTETRYIGRIVVHPRNPDVVWVAALGQAYGLSGNSERGVFRSTDGGRSWEKVLYLDSLTGAVDLAINPHHPETIFAAMWQVYRTPWALESGGPGSGIYRSKDGGQTWTRLENGLPRGLMGKIGIAVSPADGRRVYAVVEAGERERGMYRSDDGGESWELTSSDHELVQRPWYYMHVTADPKNPDTVYVPSLSLLKSTDGGRRFVRMAQYHPDNHGLWIDPENPLRMINANDGGANISVNGGRTWTRSDLNQPTGQFYHLATDSNSPYKIYGSMQDFRTIALPSRSNTGAITDGDLEVVGGCQGGFVAPHPADPQIVYHGCTDGWLMSYDRRIGLVQRIDPWPETNLGLGAEAARYRFNWTSPLMTSRHEPEALYFAANVLFKTTNRGRSWSVVSPDLTRNDKSKQGKAGGPLTKESIGIEYYNLIFALAESPREPGVLWAGSDDGLVHLTRDGGKTWQNVTPPTLPEWSRISSIDASAHETGAAYLAVDRHQLNDYGPYVYRTADFGKTWTLSVKGIPKDTYVRGVREDPARRGLLYAGTETGIFVSLDDGENWQSLQLNLPPAPVHDLLVQGDDLVVGTHGRAIWVLDDLSPLRQWREEVGRASVHLFHPTAAYRARHDQPYFSMSPPAGENPPEGAVIYYHLAERPQGELNLAILDAQGQTVRTFSSADGDAQTALETTPGLHRVAWDIRHPGPRRVPGAYVFGSLRGPTALPGSYRVRLTTGSRSYEAPLEIRPDPRVVATPEDIEAQFRLHQAIRDSYSTLADVTLRVRDIRRQLLALGEKRAAAPPPEISLRRVAEELERKLNAIEDTLTQRQARTFADTFHYGIKIDGKLASLMDVVGDGRPGLFSGATAHPTEQSAAVHDVLWKQVEAEMAKLNELITRDVPALNDLARKQGLAPIEAGLPLSRAK